MKRLLTFSCLIMALFSLNYAQAPQRQQRVIVTAWNELGASITREELLIKDLTKSLQLNPPWRVVDATAPRFRSEVIDKLINEHKKRITLLEKIKKEDGQ